MPYVKNCPVQERAQARTMPEPPMFCRKLRGGAYAVLRNFESAQPSNPTAQQTNDRSPVVSRAHCSEANKGLNDDDYMSNYHKGVASQVFGHRDVWAPSLGLGLLSRQCGMVTCGDGFRRQPQHDTLLAYFK